MIFTAEHVYIDNGIALYQANGQNWSFLMTKKYNLFFILLVAVCFFAANQANPYAYDNKKAPFQPFTDAAHVAGSADRYVAQRQYRRHFLTDR